MSGYVGGGEGATTMISTHRHRHTDTHHASRTLIRTQSHHKQPQQQQQPPPPQQQQQQQQQHQQQR